MEPSAQSTFIPRESPVMSPRIQRQGRGLNDLAVLFSVVLLVASAALAGGVFLYGQYLQSSATSKLDQVERARAAFEPALVHELTRLDDRMRAAGAILGGHIAPTAFFKMLEQATIQTVAFSTLDFQTGDGGQMTVKMAGVAASVNSIALQADLFSKGGMITSPIFSDIDRESDGVHFSLSAILNPTAVNFSQIVGVVAATQIAPTDLPSFGSPVLPGEEVTGEPSID